MIDMDFIQKNKTSKHGTRWLSTDPASVCTLGVFSEIDYILRKCHENKGCSILMRCRGMIRASYVKTRNVCDKSWEVLIFLTWMTLVVVEFLEGTARSYIILASMFTLQQNHVLVAGLIWRSRLPAISP